MILIQSVNVFSPAPLGICDVFVGGGKILAISKTPLNLAGLDLEVIDGQGYALMPGLIDAHVHICGGGGEGGFHTRTPELRVTQMIEAGVTTVVGCLGTDGITRTMENLIAKVYGLRAEGVSAYCYSGSYQVPVRTLTGDVIKDIMLIEPIIGLGEIAINDHRSSSPSAQELARLTSEARVGGILSGKAGIVNCHLGDGDAYLDLIDQARSGQMLPLTQFYPTHMNRNPELFERAKAHGLNGGLIDLTTSTTQQFIDEGEIPAAEGYLALKNAGVNLSQVTFTSDGQGSLPMFDSAGAFSGLGIGKMKSLYDSFASLVLNHGMALDEALLPVTANPAKWLKLGQKGQIALGKDADLILVKEEDLSLDTVIALGKVMMRSGEVLYQETIQY